MHPMMNQERHEAFDSVLLKDLAAELCMDVLLLNGARVEPLRDVGLRPATDCTRAKDKRAKLG